MLYPYAIVVNLIRFNSFPFPRNRFITGKRNSLMLGKPKGLYPVTLALHNHCQLQKEKIPVQSLALALSFEKRV